MDVAHPAAAQPAGAEQASLSPKACGIPPANIRQYEIGRHIPPPAVRVYLKVIEGELDVVAKAAGQAIESVSTRVIN